MLNDNYEYFLKIADCQSITKAAEQLFISQPSLSRYLSRLEENLGVSLFDRKALPIKLTQAGEVYYEYLSQAIKMEKTLRTNLQKLRLHSKDLIRIGIGNWRGSLMLPNFLSVYYAACPHSEVLVREGDTDFLENILSTDQVDFCIMSLPVRLPDLVIEPIYTEKILLLGNNKHPLVHQLIQTEPIRHQYRQIEFEDLKKETLFLTTPGQNLARQVRAYLKQMGFKTDNVREIHNLTTAYNLVKHGWGFAFLPEAGKKLKSFDDDVTFFYFGEPSLDFPIAVVYKKQTNLSTCSRIFINLLKKHTI